MPFYVSAPGGEPAKAIHLPRNICPMWTYDGYGTAEGFRSTNPVERIWRGIPSVEPQPRDIFEYNSRNQCRIHPYHAVLCERRGV